jgi:hypothetical protein
MSRLVPDLDPDAALSREEVAMFFSEDDTDEGMRRFHEAAREIPFSMRTNGETGEAEYRLSDIETIVADWKGERRAPRRPTRPSAPARRTPAPVTFADDDAALDAVLLSADVGGRRKVNVVRVKDAAERRGMTEDELSSQLLGVVKLHVHDGDLVVTQSDLGRLVQDGKVPKPISSTEPAKPEPISDPLAPPVDEAVERRTKAVAESMGIVLDAPATSSTTATADKPKGRQDGAPVTARADDDKTYRLGRPRRWGQT